MNLYVVVEGEVACVEIYKYWISYVNPELTYKDDLVDLDENNFLIRSGFGYPFYKDIIINAIHDVNENLNVDKLVVCIDSEDFTFDEKYAEIESLITNNGMRKSFSIVIQHFCIETWFLANRKLHSKNISNPILKKYKASFDTHKNDPELLPANDEEELNRANYAYKYFRLLLQEKNKHLSYSKKNPSAVIQDYFYHQVYKRYDTTEHLKSFETFLKAFTKP